MPLPLVINGGFLLWLLVVSCVVVDITAWTFKDVKDVLKTNGIDPGCVVFNPSNQNMCTCGGNKVIVRDEPDLTLVPNDLLIVYDKANLMDCEKGLTYGAYRVLMNQSDVNGAICSRGKASRDITDCKMFDPAPAPGPPGKCSDDCVDMIKKIPQGPPGPPGSREVAPSRKEVVRRDFGDLKRAFRKYTGCDMSATAYTKRWFYQPGLETFCYKYPKPVTYVNDVNDFTNIRAGYVILSHTVYPDIDYRPYTGLVYRSVEDDIVAVFCQQDLYPQFLPLMSQRLDEVECSARVNA